MKTLIKTALSMLLAGWVLTGCDKVENKVYFEGGRTPVLTATKTAVVLAPATEAQEAISFRWTNPEYRFTTGVSSHDVTYSLEFDRAGANFSSPTKHVASISKDLTKTFTGTELNAILGNSMLLPLGQVANIQVRLIATLANNSVPVISNTVAFTTTPFAPPPKVALPSQGRLFLVGGATPGSWGNPVPANQEFTKQSDTKYHITIQLTANESILLLPVNGSWDDKYGWDGASNANNVNGDNLSRGGGDIKVPAVSRLYKIEVDFQLGKFTITPA